MRTKIYEDLADLFPLWRETILDSKGHERKETNFVIDVLKKSGGKIKSVIDLGGGIGLHSGLLLNLGYDVTLFDQSKKAMALAKRNYPKLKIVYGSFEKINLQKKYDAAICMWSTLAYIFSETGRNNFYKWQKNHINKIIILDQANFYRYPKKFYKAYFGENGRYQIKIIRDWELTKANLKKTKFVYEIFDKSTGKTKIIKDSENQQYLSIEKLQKYLDPKWNLHYIYGDYTLKSRYQKNKSPRIITVFFHQFYSGNLPGQSLGL